MAERRYAYLHGFASSPNTKKGLHLADVFAKKGLLLERPELNRPSFEKLSPAAMLAAVDALDASASADAAKPWCFIGSSMGGWLAARWAELHPERVERLVLLCPGFDLATRWLSIVGTEGMEKWRADGSLLFPDGAGVLRRVHWGFYEEGSKLPGRPEVPCPTRIYHGTDLKPGATFHGPAIIEETTTSVVVAPGDVCSVDAFTNYVIRTEESSQS